MRIGVLGTGMVGRAIGGRLVGVGHEVRMGSRSEGGAAAEWARSAGPGASAGTFADAADFGELVFNCTAGSGSEAAVRAAGPAVDGKVLVDVANPLRFDAGGPSLFVGIDDSLGERLQRAFPAARVVKALNTVNCEVMVDPAKVPGDHVVFVCGEDAAAKADVTALLGRFGWPAERVVDLGGIAGARAAEGYLLLWLRMMGVVGSPHFNIAVCR